jgi:hypothetical protein
MFFDKNKKIKKKNLKNNFILINFFKFNQMTTSYQTKRKNISDKEIQDFFFMIEEKFDGNQKKIDEFMELIKQYNSQK